MGRPPIGKTAMTSGERVRRFRAKQAAAAAAAASAKHGADRERGPSASTALLAKAKVRIRELEKQVAASERALAQLRSERPTIRKLIKKWAAGKSEAERIAKFYADFIVPVFGTSRNPILLLNKEQLRVAEAEGRTISL